MLVTLQQVIETLRKHGENEMADALNQGELSIPFKNEVNDERIDWPINNLVESGTPVDDQDDDCLLDIPVIP